MKDFKKIKCIILDVDGTLTDGKLYYGKEGEEFKVFDVKDGMAIIKAIEAKLVIGVVTGRYSNALEMRMNSLGVKHIYQGTNKKVDVIKNILYKEKIEPSETMFIGDDINDIAAINYVKYSACPKDASDDILELSDYISKKSGGNGAVREIIEYILKLQNKWNVGLEKDSYYIKSEDK